MPQLDEYPTTKSDLDVEELEDEIVVNDPDRQKIYNFNGTAAFIWSLSDGSMTLNEIVDEIHRSDPTVPRTEIEDDVLDFVSELQEKELLEVKSG
ncbi:MAG: PqqD family protein [bacterium]